MQCASTNIMALDRHIRNLILILTLVSCSNLRTEPSEKLVLLNHYHNDKIFRTDTISLAKLTNNNTIKYLYKFQNDTLGFSFEKYALNDSSINLFNLRYPLISTKNIMVNGENFKIEKYFYDEKDAVDEESSYFYNDSYGFLVIFNDGWSDLSFTLEYDSISKILIENILQDRTGFYMENIPPPADKR